MLARIDRGGTVVGSTRGCLALRLPPGGEGGRRVRCPERSREGREGREGSESPLRRWWLRSLCRLAWSGR